MTEWHEWIVEFEQNGKDSAKYGSKLLETLAADRFRGAHFIFLKSTSAGILP